MLSVRKAGTSVFSLDIRSLALLRIILGLLLLSDLAIRGSDVDLMYSDDGFLTVQQSIERAGTAAWSMHWLSGDVRWQTFLLIVAAGAALSLTAGWRTRTMTIISWLLLVSLHNRNPLIVNGGDVWLRMLLLWAIFLPLGAVWSVDARRSSEQKSGNAVISAGTICLVLQLCLVYAFGGLLKVNERWLGFNPWDAIIDGLPAEAVLGGDALLRSFNYVLYRRPLAVELLSYESLLRYVALVTPFFEMLLGVVVLSPFRTRSFRMAAILIATGFHLSVEATLHLGQFSLVAIAAWWALLPSSFWDGRGIRRFLPGSIPGAESLDSGRNRHDELRSWWQWPETISCVVLISIVVAWNFGGLFRSDIRTPLRRPLQPVVTFLQLRQTWNMFGRPTNRNSQFLYVGEMKNGRIVDVVHGNALKNVEVLPAGHAAYPNHRWRKLHANLGAQRNTKYRTTMAAALYRSWNRTHPPDEELIGLAMYRFLLPTVPDVSELPRENCALIEHGVPVEIEQSTPR
jgi:hypothetical protein